METKRAGEIMIPLDRFPHIPYWFTLRQAMAEVGGVGVDTKRRCPCGLVLVFSAQNQLLGMLRQQDILRGLRPEIDTGKANSQTAKLFDVKVDANLYKLYDSEKAVAMLPRQLERPVGDFILPVDAVVNHDDDLLQTVYLMIEKGNNYILVQRENRIEGVVTALDALREIARLVI
jgi:hypothetical protein